MKIGRQMTRAEVHKLLEERRKSFPLRVEAQANHVFLQREVRRRMLDGLRQAEKNHIGEMSQNSYAGSEYMTRLRREMLLASLNR